MRFLLNPIDMKCILSMLVGTVCFVGVYAQDKDSSDRFFASQQSLKGSQIGFSFSTIIPGSGNITNTSSQYTYKPFAFVGAEAGINYRHGLSNGYALVTGLHGGKYKRSFRFVTTKDKFNPQLQNDVYITEKHFGENVTTDYFASLPVLLEKQWQNKKCNRWGIFAGLSVRRYWVEAVAVNGEYWLINDLNGGATAVLHRELLSRNDNKLLLNFNTGAGYSIFLNNYNFLRFALTVNYSPAHLLQYKYTVPFATEPQPGGTYTVNMNYVGLSIEYSFTNIKAKLRMEEE